MRTRSLLAFAVLAAVALTVAGAAFSRTDSTPTLKGVVGPGYSIKLTKGGKKFESLKAGTYKFVISDRSNFHNFTVEREKPSKPKLEHHLTGTGFTGTKTVMYAQARQLELLLLQPRSADARRLQGHEVGTTARGRQQAAASATSGRCT